LRKLFQKLADSKGRVFGGVLRVKPLTSLFSQSADKIRRLMFLVAISLKDNSLIKL